MKRPLDQVFREADQFFMGRSPVHEGARRIAAALDEINVPFAIAGAMAVNAHGHRRETTDVDVLLTRDGLAKFKERWLGLGWVEKFAGSKGMRDAVAGTKIDVLLTGEYPGDGKPKPIAFPDPAQASELGRGEFAYPVLKLPVLLELKIASGISASHRRQDLADAMNLIKANRLPRSYADQLDPYVRPTFLTLWDEAQIDEDY
jgi:hypothetical protein